VSTENFAGTVAAWAAHEPSVGAVILIGSHVRAADDAVWRADAQSDWDFQIIAARPQLFADSAWTRGLAGTTLRTYAARQTRVGRVPKINALFAGAEADFVVLPQRSMRLMKLLVALGLHRRPGRVRRALQDLAIVVRPGWRFLKGAEKWEPFYRQVVAEVPDARLGDAEARGMADGFACDYVWTLRKLDRGELLAAQRMLHQSLAETNFRLLHELRLRRGERSFPEARRIERLGGPELGSVSVNGSLDAGSLRLAVEKSAATCRELTRGLLGEGWHSPELK
jgi:hypothetical protein